MRSRSVFESLASASHPCEGMENVFRQEGRVGGYRYEYTPVHLFLMKQWISVKSRVGVSVRSNLSGLKVR